MKRIVGIGWSQSVSCFPLESECQAPYEVSAVLVIGYFRSVAAVEGAAVCRQGRIRIGRHVTCISPERKMPRQCILHAAANAEGKIEPRRVAPTIEFVREAQPPAM